MSENNYSQYLQNILLIGNSNAFKQLVFLAGVALSVTVGFYVYNTIQEPIYRPLDYKMTDKNAGVIADALDKAHIKYKINDSTGVVMVAASDLQTAKYKLASAGVQKDDSISFSYLSEQNGIGESQFIENARYLRALENDLVRTITAIEGVSGAKVHIAIPSNNIYADETAKPTASVFITVGAGMLVDKEKVRSIVQIVSSSVPGLDPKDVAITDQYGHYLSDAFNQNSLMNQEQMTYQNNVQGYYEKRIESIISPLIGQNKVSVKVHADIDFTTQEEAKEEYDPNQKAVRSEQTTTEESGSSGASGAPGSLANSPPSGKSSEGAKSDTTTQGRSSSIKNYELSKSVTYKKSNVAKIKTLSVAVVLDNYTAIDPKTKKSVSKPIDKDLMNKIQELVKATIGYNQSRGDIVTVVNGSFNVEKPVETVEKTPFYMEAWFWELIKKVGSIIFGLFGFVLIYKWVMRYFQELKKGVGTVHAGAANENGLSPEMQQLKQEQINRLKELASNDPSRVALVIKNWIVEK